MRAVTATVGLRPAAAPDQGAVSADERRRSRGETYPQLSSKLLDAALNCVESRTAQQR
jgi:hypothetical protein